MEITAFMIFPCCLVSFLKNLCIYLSERECSGAHAKQWEWRTEGKAGSPQSQAPDAAALDPRALGS